MHCSEGSLISATIKKGMFSKFKPLIEEGSVYVVKNFEVVESMGKFKVVDSKVKIVFTLYTSVKKTEDDFSIERHCFQFQPASVIEARMNDDTLLTDIVGCLTMVKDLVRVGMKGHRKRDIEIITHDSGKCKVTLWDEFAENFDIKNEVQKPDEPLIIIITSTRVSSFQGVLNFSTTNASRILLNIKNKYVETLAKQFSKNVPQVPLYESSSFPEKTFEEEMSANRMTIDEFLSSDWRNKTPGYAVTIVGVIDDIDEETKWYYLGCGVCKQKGKEIGDGVYKCRCKEDLIARVPLYKLNLHVKDEMSSMTCVALHGVTKRMLDSSPSKFISKDGTIKEEIPYEIKQLCGRKFVFKLGITDYNITYGHDKFTVKDFIEVGERINTKLKQENGTGSNSFSTNDVAEGSESQESSLTSTSIKKRKLDLGDEQDKDELVKNKVKQILAEIEGS